jgi:hypothetical protein
MTSNVSFVSEFVANGHQIMPYGSCSPSKIPYGGFSPVRLQTGMQSQPSLPGSGLSARPTSPRTLVTYMRLRLLTRKRAEPTRNRALAQADLSPLLPSVPVQRPLALRRVMLSLQVIAYYGLMRNSHPLLPIYALYGRSLPYGLVWAEGERLPNLLRLSLSTVPPSVPRWTRGVPLTVPSPSALAFTIFAQVRHPHAHARRFSRGERNEAAKFASCYGPVELIALHRQGRLHSSFHRIESPQSDVEYIYAGKQSIPAAGLSPARHAALWAASKGRRGIHLLLWQRALRLAVRPEALEG